MLFNECFEDFKSKLWFDYQSFQLPYSTHPNKRPQNLLKSFSCICYRKLKDKVIAFKLLLQIPFNDTQMACKLREGRRNQIITFSWYWHCAGLTDFNNIFDLWTDRLYVVRRRRATGPSPFCLNWKCLMVSSSVLSKIYHVGLFSSYNYSHHIPK